MASSTRRDNDKRYAKKVYELPSDELENLCSVLDEDESWKDLGRECLKLKPAVLKKIARNTAMRNESPTEELIRQMGSLDYSIEQLYQCLYHVKNFKAMETIKSFVHPRCHYLIPENLTSESIMTDRKHEERKELLPTGGTSSEGSTMLKHIPSFSCDKLQAATGNWSSENKVGEGSFGVVLQFKLGGTDYVVKLLRPTKKERDEVRVIEPRQMLRRLKKELYFSNKCRHDNILSLYGWSVCEEKRIYALVYPFMARKSLREFIHKKEGTFRWQTRMKIAKGIACGLICLHSTMSPPVVHADIKSDNILLDQNFCPKIGDFGLARQLPYDQCSFVLDASYRGTKEYSPPEYRHPGAANETFQGEFSTKVDIYAFGVVLYEIITGQNAKILDRVITELDYEPNDIYKRLKISDIPMSEDDSKDCELLTSLGELCIEKDRISRPEIVHVFSKFGESSKTTESASASEIESDNTGSTPLLQDSYSELMDSSVPDEDMNLNYYELDSDESDDDSSC